MLYHRVYARLQHFLGDIYSTMKETKVSASHENNGTVRQCRATQIIAVQYVTARAPALNMGSQTTYCWSL